MRNSILSRLVGLNDLYIPRSALIKWIEFSGCVDLPSDSLALNLPDVRFSCRIHLQILFR
jgi:hypothetical protein